VEEERCSTAQWWVQTSSATNIAKMLAALAVFGHTQRPLLGRLANIIVDRITEFSSEALADIVYAYAMLGTTSERLINTVLQQVWSLSSTLP
jgi:FAST kinase-like protein, subdomain 1